MLPSNGRYTRLTNDAAVPGTSRPGVTVTITPGAGQVRVFIFNAEASSVGRAIDGLLNGRVPPAAITHNGLTNSYRLEVPNGQGITLGNPQMDRDLGNVDFAINRPDINRAYTFQAFYRVELVGAAFNFVRYNTSTNVTLHWYCVVD